MTEQLSKAEKLARKMHNIISGGQSFNKQVAAQVRDELRRQEKEHAEHIQHLTQASAEIQADLRAQLATARADALRAAAEVAHEYGETQYAANVANFPQYADEAQYDAQEIARAILALIDKETDA